MTAITDPTSDVSKKPSSFLDDFQNNSDNRTSDPFSSRNDNGPAPAAVIGSKIKIRGELVGEEDLLVEGQVEGIINLNDNVLTVGENGVLKANASAKTITIEGRVEGDLLGEENIVIKATSQVTGNLVAPRVSLEDGAQFRGSIDMDLENRRAEFQEKMIHPSLPREAAAPKGRDFSLGKNKKSDVRNEPIAKESKDKADSSKEKSTEPA